MNLNVLYESALELADFATICVPIKHVHSTLSYQLAMYQIKNTIDVVVNHLGVLGYRVVL